MCKSRKDLFMRNKIFNKKGFTVVEMLVCTMLIAMTLFVVVLLQNTTLNLVPASRNLQLRTEGYNLMMYDLYTDIKSATSIDFINPQEVIIHKEDEDTHYVISNNELIRNDKNVIKIVNGSFQYFNDKLTITFNLEDYGSLSYGISTIKRAI